MVGPDHLRQIWGYTKEAADFVMNIFKLGGYKCGHCLVSTIKPNTEEVLDTVNFMDNIILIFNRLDKGPTCFLCLATSFRGEGPAIP